MKDTAATPGVAGSAACPHCGTAVEGADDLYCCSGCALAAEIIRDAGLERYYDERDAYAPRPQGVLRGWDSAPTFACSDGMAETRLAVDGLRCASCVWVTERVLAATPGVQEATVSYATGRTHLKWDPQQTSLGALAERIARLGYQPRVLGEETRPNRDLTLRLGVAVFAAANVMLMTAALYAGWIAPMELRFQRLFSWGALVLATPVALWCAEPFFRGAVQGLKNRTLHMDFPIALAIGVLYVHGVVGTLLGLDTYLDSLTMLVALLLVGRVLESRGRRHASEAATTLAASVPAMARRVGPAGIENVPTDSLATGDLIEVAMGEEIAADGVVTAGAGSVIMAVVTGESAPIGVAPSDKVVAGGILESGALTVRVEAAGEATMVGRMAEAVAEAAGQPRSLTTTDRLAPWFTGATLAVAGATFLAWFELSTTAAAIEATVAVLVVACPCALALARPLAGLAGLGAAAKRGTLFRSIDALLALNGVDTVALDKTGTVTGGALVVTRASPEALRIAAGLERSSIHPVARAIVAAAAEQGIPLPQATAIREHPGRGIEGIVDGKHWTLEPAGPGLIALKGEDGSPEVMQLGDRMRRDSREAVAGLRTLGLRVALLTGDHHEVAERIAREADIHEVYSKMVPEAKAEWISAQHASGHSVAFVGDGINDGPALAKADVGLSMRSGAGSSLLVADGVVAGGSLKSVLSAMTAARLSAQAARRNETRSIVYNIVAVTAAAAGLINPLAAAVLMPLSSAMVVATALRVEPQMRRLGR